MDNERNQQEALSEASNKASERKAESVDETGNDTQIYTDSEGTGSQGRAFTEPVPEENLEETTPDNTSDDDHPHIDLQA